MRIPYVLAVGLATAALCACGGGGSAPAPTALLSGKVTSLDGSTLDRSGVVVASADGLAVTGADGAFVLAVAAGEPIVLRFEDEHADERPDVPRDDVPEDDDATPDGADIDGDEIELEPLDQDERCEIEVDIEDGEVTGCRVDRPDREDDERVEFEAECRLRPNEGSSEPEAIAEAELECAGDCCLLEVELGEVLDNETLSLFVECEEVRAELGVIEIVEGRGRFVLEHCTRSEVPLPFEAETLRDLAGCWLLLVDAADRVALMGCFPGKRDDDEDRDEGEGEDGDDGEEPYVEDARLEPVDGSSEPEAVGGAVVRCEDDCCTLVVEVGEVVGSDVLTAAVDCEGVRVELGALEIVEGAGRLEVEFCDEAPRPHGAASLRALAGCTLVVLDAEGTVALSGPFPGRTDEGEDGDEGDDVEAPPAE